MEQFILRTPQLIIFPRPNISCCYSVNPFNMTSDACVTKYSINEDQKLMYSPGQLLEKPISFTLNYGLVRFY